MPAENHGRRAVGNRQREACASAEAQSHVRAVGNVCRKCWVPGGGVTPPGVWKAPRLVPVFPNISVL